MLIKVDAALKRWSAKSPGFCDALHRPMQAILGELVVHSGGLAMYGQEPDIKVAQSKLHDLWFFALGWYIVRIGEPADSVDMTKALARRIRLGKAAAATEALDADILGNALDLLVEKVGYGIFDFTAFFRVARQLQFDDIDQLEKGLAQL